MGETRHEKLKNPIEIEKKYLVVALPENLAQHRSERIRQGYIAIAEDDTEVRVRDRDGAYTLTVKSKGDLTRGEWETAITPEQFETLWPTTSGKRVEKTRYSIPHGTDVIEMDIYEGDLQGLVTAEVEFANELAAESFVAPDWFGTDVTTDKTYKNQNLALHGLPV